MIESYFELREGCPGCKSTHRKELYSTSFTEPPISTYLEDFYLPQGGIEFDYLKSINFVLDECNECGLIYQRLIPNNFLMTKLYEEWLDPKRAFKSKVKNKELEYYSRLAREIETYIRYFGVAPCELQLFDFGMGWGEWCRMAQSYGCSVFGTELSQARIDFAKTFGISIVKWEEIPEQHFDFINTEQVFEHIANPLETLLYLCKSLKTGGIIKISVPNGWDMKRKLSAMDWTAPKNSKNSLNPIAPLEHINCFSQGSLLRMAQIADLVPIQIQAKVTIDRRLLDFTLRDILRPSYQLMLKVRFNQEIGFTNLCFQKRTV